MRSIFALALVLAVVACGKKHSGTDGNGSGDASGMPGNPIIIDCPGCPQFPPPGMGTTCTGAGADPQLVYPPDSVLLPPNMNVIEVQFMPGAGNTIFEIDFENAATDVRFETMCNAITDTRGNATGGCAFQLSPTDWNYVSSLNAGGDPVTVTVRAAPADLSCIAGSNSRKISFATMPLMGGIYYWQSLVFGTVAGTAGGIFRKDFGNPDPTPEPFLTPTASSNKCVGCHYLSHDGAKMVVGTDDADSDDELGDDHFYLYDVATRAPTALMNMSAKGFAAWQGAAHDHVALGDGGGMQMTPGLIFPIDGTTAAGNTFVSFATTAGLVGKRVTNPDWSRDGAMVYFTATTPITGISVGGMTYNNKDDIHAQNGSIWQVPFANNTFGTPTEIVTPAGATENDYYPSISPDGSALIFNRAVGTAGNIGSLDAYNNPGAQLYAMGGVSGTTPSGTPIALANANLASDPNSGVTLTNSWPRFSPAVQMYKGHRLLWVTFSSTRDYGLRVANEGAQYFNCYPPVSPEDPSGDHKKPVATNCTQPQIWMAAIDLDALQAGNDPSYPAFWLPFQDYTAHNHIAQWVDSIQSQNCSQIGQSCAMGCCMGLVCDQTSQQCISSIP